MTERLARARGTNPDLIRREDPVYLAAADAADAPRRSLIASGRRRPATGPRPLELPDERIPHQIDHVEVPRQQVLEHEPLDARRLELAHLLAGLPRACR